MDGPLERYELTWAGKREAIRVLGAPCRAALAPCSEHSGNTADPLGDRPEPAHLFIEGDNLEALKLLQRPYSGRVRMIYIDPPYNTGQEFIYSDNYAAPRNVYLQMTGQKDAAGNLLSLTPETNGRFHSSWLSMMYPRLVLARRLLRNDGFLCVSIGEEELANLRLLLNEIFGEESYRNTLLVRRYDKNLNRQFIARGLTTLNVGAEYILVYSRGPEATLNPVYRPAPDQRQRRGYWKGFWNAADRPTMRYDVLGVTPTSGQWKWKQDVARDAVCNYLEFLTEYANHMTLEEYWETTGRTKRFIRRNPKGKGKNLGVEHWIPPSSGILRTSNWTDLLASGPLTGLPVTFESPKNVEMLKELIRMCCDRTGLVLDFFAGSGTTAQAVLELNHEDGGHRRFLMVQLPEPTGNPELPTICDIGKARIRQVIMRLLASGAWENGTAPPEALEFEVFRLVTSNRLDGEPVRL